VIDPNLRLQAAEALLKLAADRPWREITLHGVAAEAGLDLARLYESVQTKSDLLAVISRDHDLAALRTASTPSEDPHDRLFDAVMARVEVMEPHRASLTLIAREAPALVARHVPATARALLEAAGLEGTAPRILAMSLLWGRIAQVWRDDEGALNRTMAEIDKRLRQMRAALLRVGAGF
jgi:AcrR family transcriptional regulator